MTEKAYEWITRPNLEFRIWNLELCVGNKINYWKLEKGVRESGIQGTPKL